MKHTVTHMFGLTLAAMFACAAAPVIAQTTANGPYYATPSWDQTLPVSTRFVVLSNFNSEAVLDRETGLVWERNASVRPGFNTSGGWRSAFDYCRNQKTGNRLGWRVPRLEEFATLVEGTTNHLPVGHPFVFSGNVFWTSTSDASIAGQAWSFLPNSNFGSFQSNPKTGVFLGFWCVRGGVGAETQ